MKHVARAIVLSIGLSAGASPLWAAEPLVGLWRLQRQEINGTATEFDPLALQISQNGDRLRFAFSVPMPDIYFVTITYTLRLDGSSADIIDGNNQKVGTIQMTAQRSAPVRTHDEGTEQSPIARGRSPSPATEKRSSANPTPRSPAAPFTPNKSSSAIESSSTLFPSTSNARSPADDFLHSSLGRHHRRALHGNHGGDRIGAGLSSRIGRASPTRTLARVENTIACEGEHRHRSCQRLYPAMRIVSLAAPNPSNPTFVATLGGRGRLIVACDPATGERSGAVAAASRVAGICTPVARNVVDRWERPHVERGGRSVSPVAGRDRAGELVAGRRQLAARTQSGLPVQLAQDQFRPAQGCRLLGPRAAFALGGQRDVLRLDASVCRAGQSVVAHHFSAPPDRRRHAKRRRRSA